MAADEVKGVRSGPWEAHSDEALAVGEVPVFPYTPDQLSANNLTDVRV